jgi:twinkle protein
MRRDDSSGTFLHHTSCPACGSSDANAVYSNGSTYCWACSHWTRSTDNTTLPQRRRMAAGLIDSVEIKGLPARKISEETCRHFGYGVGTLKSGESVHVAPYFDANGDLVAQKSRTRDKAFKVHGSLDTALPFGAHAFPKAGKKIVVTEGEIDAMSVSQLQDNKWPVVSIACGADREYTGGTKIRKYFAQHMGYFAGFETVVLMFDMDAPGKFSAQCAAEVLGSRALIAELPLKDPNECLVQGKGADVIKAMWNARRFRPEGIIDIASLRDVVKESTPEGIPYTFAGLNRITHGFRTGELIAWGGGTGSGKTDIATEVIRGLVMDHGLKVGGFFLESTPVEFARRFAGKIVGIPFHIPGHGTPEEYTDAWEQIEASGGSLYLYDSFGVNEWPAVRAKIEWLYHSEGVGAFWLDHLTAFAAADPSREREILEEVMGDMGSLVKKLPITIHFVSHLSTPEGKPHEEGGHVSMRHFKGARAIGFWTHLAFGIERNQQAKDPAERHITTVRCVKNRPFGHLNGETFTLQYSPSTGRLHEVSGTPVENHLGFGDETDNHEQTQEF